MKPTITWVIVADASSAQVFVNHGPGKGLEQRHDLVWKAEAPVDYADRAGMAHSSHGHGSSGMTRHDPRALAEAAFARDVAAHLAEHHDHSDYDRLLLVAAPHMLGKLRGVLDDKVRDSVVGEVDKDLTKIPVHDLPSHLADVLAV
jgi:protein required for attachment to host cells